MKEVCRVREEIMRRRTETLDFLQAMPGQLRITAEAERCDMLGHLIGMAYIKASDIIRGERPPRLSQDKRDSAA